MPVAKLAGMFFGALTWLLPCLSSHTSITGFKMVRKRVFVRTVPQDSKSTSIVSCFHMMLVKRMHWLVYIRHSNYGSPDNTACRYSAAGALSCIACPRGRAAANTQSSECALCPQGKHVVSLLHVTVLNQYEYWKCAVAYVTRAVVPRYFFVGQFQDKSQRQTCKTCAAGRVAPEVLRGSSHTNDLASHKTDCT